jgi:sulfate-transporting ATPase
VKSSENSMAQYIYTMSRVGKVVPPKREILKDISLSFFPGAKIGVLGLNGSGKSTLLRIMAGVDTDILGEARPQPGIKIGLLSQEPQLDPSKDVRGNVEEAVQPIKAAQARLEEVYAAYADPTPISRSWPPNRRSWKLPASHRWPQSGADAGCRRRRTAIAGLGCRCR